MNPVSSIKQESICPACTNTNELATKLDYSTFRHLDFSAIDSAERWPNVLCECANCGVIYRIFNDYQGSFLSGLYRSEEYASHHEDHMVRGDDGALKSACDLQADILFRHVQGVADCRAILDIGCFEGKLLTAISKRAGAARLVGYDVAPRAKFPTAPGFEFLTGNRTDIRGKFGLILLAQSLIYIADLDRLFAELDRLLAPRGAIFIHVPNTAVRPSTVLLGDQVFYFTPGSLVRLLEKSGFTAQLIDSLVFPRDILCLAYRRDEAVDVSPGRTHVHDSAGSAVFSRLEEMERTILVAGSVENVTILGTTIEAAFTHSLIPDRVLNFVDENPLKQARLFNGKKVLDPSSLHSGATCIVPMGRNGAALVDRLSKLYQGRFCLV